MIDNLAFSIVEDSMKSNSAVTAFTSEEDCREFDKWYSADIIKYLIHEDALGKDFLKYVFLDGADFVEQVQILRMVQTGTNKGFCFICKEPGAGENHFIFGVLADNKIVFVNPVGQTLHHDFYQIALRIKQDLKLEIYISTDSLQKDNLGLSSCGPIVTELMKHISRLGSQEILKKLSLQTLQEKEGLKYIPCDIGKLLPRSLESLPTETQQYEERILSIRELHYETLQKSNGIRQVEDQNKYWDKALNHPVQTIINSSVLDKKSVTDSLEEINKYLGDFSSRNFQRSKVMLEPDTRGAMKFENKDVRSDSEYDENMILMVWDNYISQKLSGIKYFITEEETLTQLLREDQMSPKKDAGLLIKEDDTLYTNHLGYSVSICGPVHKHGNSSGTAVVIANMQVAIEQITAWNNTHATNKIDNHQIIFPYHITNDHWALGVLHLNFAQGTAEIKIYNPLPEHGGQQISDEAHGLLNRLLQSQLGLQLCDNHPSTHINQQNDGRSCGAISAENGKDFLDSETSGKTRLEIVYALGAVTLRLQHLNEVGRQDFCDAQSNNYLDPKHSNPQNYDELKELFADGLGKLSPEAKEQLLSMVQAIHEKNSQEGIAVNVKDFIKAHKDSFDQKLLAGLFKDENGGYKFSGDSDSINTLINIIQDYMGQGDVKHSSAPKQRIPKTQVTKNVLTEKKSEEIEGEIIRVRELKLKKDLDNLIEIKRLIIQIFELGNNQKLILEHLQKIGEYIHNISWDQYDKGCIRNKHGYRNRHIDSGNEKNTGEESAKLDFEELAHLKDLAKDSEFNWVLNGYYLVLASLSALMEKVDFILDQEDKFLDDAQCLSLGRIVPWEVQASPDIFKRSEFADEELRMEAEQLWDEYVQSSMLLMMDSKKSDDFLRVVSAWYHDSKCINKLIDLVVQTKEVEYSNDKVDQYFLAYIFVQIGEIAKEVSDFIKIESLRWLFSGLGDYRDKIKGLGKIVGPKLSQMYKEFEEASPILKQLLFILKEILSEYKSVEQLKNYDSIGKKIEEKFLSFEQSCQWQVDKAKKQLKDGVKNFEKTQKILEEEVEQLKISLKSLEVETALLNNQHDNRDFNAEQTKLYELFLKIESGRQSELYKGIDKLFKFLTEQPKAQDNVRELKLKDLFLHKDIKEKGFYLQFKRQLKKLGVNNIEQFEELRVSEYCDVINIILKEHKNLQLSGLKSQIANKAEELQAIEKKIVSSVKKQKSEDTQVFKKSVGLTLSEFDKLVVRVIEETELLQLLYTRITEMKVKTGANKLLVKFIGASKMSFGLLGQMHKLLKSEHKSAMKAILVSHSILSDDCFSIIVLRHKKLMHDVINSNLNHEELSLVIYNKVAPWLKDFKYIPICSRDQGILPQQLVSGLIPEDSRLVSNFNTFSENDKKIFYWYTKIVALNRFLQSQKAIDEYKELQTLLVEVSNMELLTEIHWQASLSYRNLGEFKNVIKVLRVALEAAKKIKDLNIQNFKVCGIHCDIGIAYIEEDDFETAENHLRQVITNSKASDYQIIGANFLIGEIKLLQGYSVISKSYMELIFVKYFKHIIDYNPIMAFSLIEQLSYMYLNEFDLESARDALQLGSEIYKKYYSEFVVRQGQHVIYYKALLQANRLQSNYGIFFN